MPTGAGPYPRALRIALAREHLGAAAGSAEESGARHLRGVPAGRGRLWTPGTRAGGAGHGPPGSSAAYPAPQLSAWTRAWATVPYRLFYDPDGRPLSWRRAGRF